ncbi:SDR family NAD(P)-dependent oxidoreductase [Pseudomonas sp. NBRC 100443]|uniref:SDR family NAD(P)-dependent oxidoreductase n=1 Tax=Pseudomonas sp. NBRC 100443 TaxID=1113665 RepID=UPI0024A5419F|nr:SDR family NAD(P)-dependent oxidoreductase [Pseudomonas sp. NBRC 100443]GLU37351.1 3-oxoacyl-ACP reductase [Pseudomonas sp. NBRC 100443]
MDLEIAGKVALVTGGSKGIGRSISLEMADNGCKVIVVAREQKAIDETLELIRAKGGTAIGISADLTVLENYQHVVDQATRELGAPDIAIFNLVAPKPGHFDDLTQADFDYAYHIVVSCFAALVRAVTPAMKEKRWGRIVTVGSGTAKQPVRSSAGFSYVLANTHRIAAVGLTKTLAADLGPYGIALNTIGCGSVETEQFKDWMQLRATENGITYEQMVERWCYQRIPLSRLGKPSDLAALCALLSSNRLFTSGETILCDGGQVESML